MINFVLHLSGYWFSWLILLRLYQCQRVSLSGFREVAWSLFECYFKLNKTRQMLFMEENKNYEDFLQVTTRSDVATYLGGSLKNLSYNFYVLPKEKQYTKFAIQKKGGGERHICAPASSIKLYQRRLATILSPYYSTKPTVHGYALNKSIKTNAKVHCRRRWIW